MADLSTTLWGLELTSPLVLASGPLSHDGRALVAASRAGAGAVVTKTIALTPAQNPAPHLLRVGTNTLLNCEQWSDRPYRDWVEREIGVARDGGAVVIASLGLGPDDVRALAGPVAAAGAHAVELVSYSQAAMVPMVREARRRLQLPVLAKVSPNWPEVAATAAACVAAGADGITATDSFGPVLRVDVRTARPLLGSADGYGWLSGAAIKPLVLRVVSEIARAVTVPIIGTGGVTTGEDALELLMVGATAVGVCSLPLLQGLGSLARLNRELAAALERYGYDTPRAARGVALPHLGEPGRRLSFQFASAACSTCRRCEHVCPYRARVLSDTEMILDSAQCRNCGLCVSVCPTGALSYRGYGG
jgi:dihydroorotate dehydrogenase (fumarate)